MNKINCFKMFVLSLIVSIAAFAATGNGVLIYEYQLSYKTIKAQTTKFNCNGKYTLDTAKVGSDKLTGYVVVNACEKCNGAMTCSSDDDNAAIIYVTRKGDSNKRVYRAVGALKANMFGSKVAKNPTTGDTINEDKFTDCSAWLSFPLDFGTIDGNGIFGSRNISLGQYDGEATFDDFKKDPDLVCWNTGFGKVARESYEIDYGCYSEANNCYYIKSLSGNMMAETGFVGRCVDFLFDICDTNSTSVCAPVYGTFSVKFNKSLTYDKNGYKAISFEEAEEIIREKMKFAEVYVPYNDTADEDYDLQEGLYWSDAE